MFVIVGRHTENGLTTSSQVCQSLWAKTGTGSIYRNHRALNAALAEQGIAMKLPVLQKVINLKRRIARIQQAKVACM